MADFLVEFDIDSLDPQAPLDAAAFAPITVEELIDPANTLPARTHPLVVECTGYIQKHAARTKRDGERGLADDLVDARSEGPGSDVYRRSASLVDDLVLRWQRESRGLVDADQLRWLRARVADNFLGAGAIEPLRRDPRVTEILVAAPGPREVSASDGDRVTRRMVGGTRVEVHGMGLVDAPGVLFADDDEVLSFVETLMPGNPPNLTQPTQSATLRDGSRVEVAHRVVTDGQHTFMALRRHPDVVWTLSRLVDLGTVSPDLACDLAWYVRQRLNMVVAGGTGSGKALDVDTPIPTPTGFVSMGQLAVGDQVFAEDGTVCHVTGAFDVQLDRPCFEVVFSDGTVIVADAEHLWETETRTARRAKSRAKQPRARALYLNDAQVARLHGEYLNADPDEAITVGQACQLLDWSRRDSRRSTLHSLATRLTVAGTRPVIANGAHSGRTVTAWATGPVRHYNKRAFITAMLDRWTRPLNDQRRNSATAAVVTTEDIRRTLRTPSGHANHSIPVVTHPIALPERSDLRLDPYIVGAWLGDGTVGKGEMTTADPEMVESFISAGFPTRRYSDARYNHGVRGLMTLLREEGILHGKHIPAKYLFAGETQRRDLLAGLMDTDGCATGAGSVEFANTNERFARDVRALACSLGYKATIRVNESWLDGVRHKDCYTVEFTPGQTVFRLPRKTTAWTAARDGVGRQGDRHATRYVVDVRPVASRPVRCIEVDSPSRLYLAGETMVPTHNTSLMNALCSFIDPRFHVAIVEDTKEMKTPPFLWTSRRVARPARGQVAPITIRDHIRAALRSRPDIIMVGEVRGPEALDALKAMNTGHEGSMTTCHSNSAHDTVLRLETMVSESGEVSESAATHAIASSVDLIVFQSRMPDGSRKVTAVYEVAKPPLDSTARTTFVQLRPLWLYDRETGLHERLGEPSEELLAMRGLPRQANPITMADIRRLGEVAGYQRA
jgi:Flp pilus assembly CpaF family ATPase